MSERQIPGSVDDRQHPACLMAVLTQLVALIPRHVQYAAAPGLWAWQRQRVRRARIARPTKGPYCPAFVEQPGMENLQSSRSQ